MEADVVFDLSEVFPLDVVLLVMDAVYASATWSEYVQFVELGATWARIGRANLSAWIKRRTVGETIFMSRGGCEGMKFVGRHMQGMWAQGDDWRMLTD